MSDHITDPHASGQDHGLTSALHSPNPLPAKFVCKAKHHHSMVTCLEEEVRVLTTRAEAAEAVAERWRAQTEQARAEVERVTRELKAAHGALDIADQGRRELEADSSRLRAAVEDAAETFRVIAANLEGRMYRTAKAQAKNAAKSYTTAALSPAPGEVAQNDADAGRALLAWLDRYEAETKALPLGAGSPVGWHSAYNARIAVVREARAAISAASVLGFPAPGDRLYGTNPELAIVDEFTPTPPEEARGEACGNREYDATGCAEPLSMSCAEHLCAYCCGARHEGACHTPEKASEP